MNRTLLSRALPVLATATALTLAACSGSSSSPSGHEGMPGMTSTTSPPVTSTPASPAAAGPHSQADVDFATGMIPHHRQAVTMAEMALSKATSPAVKELATAIKGAQDPEIRAMSGWLTGWGRPVPSGSGGHDMSQMGSPSSSGSSTSGTNGMGGMMTDQEMQQLSNATGAAFDRMWLQMMIKHHQGAVAMSQTELATGTNAEAKKLAQVIIDAQTREITTMTQLLGTIGG
jgi:uncharacterized protein (DUF305 family)